MTVRTRLLEANVTLSPTALERKKRLTKLFKKHGSNVFVKVGREMYRVLGLYPSFVLCRGRGGVKETFRYDEITWMDVIK